MFKSVRYHNTHTNIHTDIFFASKKKRRNLEFLLN